MFYVLKYSFGFSYNPFNSIFIAVSREKSIALRKQYRQFSRTHIAMTVLKCSAQRPFPIRMVFHLMSNNKKKIVVQLLHISNVLARKFDWNYFTIIDVLTSYNSHTAHGIRWHFTHRINGIFPMQEYGRFLNGLGLHFALIKKYKCKICDY